MGALCSSVAIISNVESALAKVITNVQLLELIAKGPPLNVYEHKRVTINDVTFVTHSYERCKGRRSRKICFYTTPSQKDAFANPQATINYPIARIDRILVVQSTHLLQFMSAYKLLKVRNYKYVKEGHASELPYVDMLSQAETNNNQPFINANTVKPYNVALWPASANKLTKRFLAVWINPHHEDYC